jgi:nicotinate phosphoribosyltransferase
MDQLVLRHPTDHSKCRVLARDQISKVEPLLEEIISEGKIVYDFPSIEGMRQNRISDMERLDPGVRRIMYPHIYHVSLTQRLWDLKQKLIGSVIENSHH